MVQWIAISVALVCLSDLSLSRSWVSFDEDDDYESGLADPDDEPNWKSKYHSGGVSWESGEDYEDSGSENYQTPTNYQGHRHNHDDHAFGYHKHDYPHDHGFGHPYHGNYENNHPGHGQNDNNYGTPNKYGHAGHNTGPSSNWGPSQHGHGQSMGNYNHENGYHDGHAGKPTQAGYKGHNYGSHLSGQNHGAHGYHSHTGSHGHPVQTGSPAKPALNSGSPPRGSPQNNPNRQDTGSDADRVVFPDFNNQAITTNRVPPTSTQPAVSTAATPAATTPSSTTTDRSLLDLVICVRACPATAEYNPVCGSNNVTYNNPGALQCAKNCGLNVTIARRAPCPRPIPRPSSSSPITNSPAAATTTKPEQTTTTTPAPTVTPATVKPTRFTNIDVNAADKSDSTLIPLDVLQSIFGSAVPTNTDVPESGIGKRSQP